jgi:DDE superfamily endonuclease/Helix-turn-helix of DDE superfamily endonuclease
MNAHDRLKKKPTTFRQLTGLSIPEFDKLLAELAVARQTRREQQQQRRPRRRRPGGGRHPKLALADQLLLVLIYYRTYVTQDFLGFLFQIDKGTACRILQAIGLLLVGLFRIPETKVQIHPDEIAEAFVDATEQPTYRPQKKQRRSYSGKKKRHTVKHQVVVVRKKKRRGQKNQTRKVRIAAVSEAAKGKVHDKKLYDQSRMKIPPGVQKTGDSGYQGTDLKVPQKKPRGGTLSARTKRGNRRLSQRRIVVEHGIGKMKIWRIAAERYRNPLRGHTRMMKNVAGLHNRMFG